MAQINKFGLSRTVPAAIKREIRQACGFGCVICGGIVIDYEHIDPEFADAKAHDPARMALLCPGCHAKVTRGYLAKDEVKRARAAPVALRRGYSNEFLTVGKRQPRIMFGGMTIEECPVPVEVQGVPLIKVEPAEIEGGPLLLTAHFFNGDGQESLQIERNEWRILEANNWDVEIGGPIITVRQGERHVSLRLSARPPDLLVVETLDMRVGKWVIRGDPDKLEVGNDDEPGFQTFIGCFSSGAPVGFAIG